MIIRFFFWCQGEPGEPGKKGEDGFQGSPVKSLIYFIQYTVLFTYLSCDLILTQ